MEKESEREIKGESKEGKETSFIYRYPSAPLTLFPFSFSSSSCSTSNMQYHFNLTTPSITDCVYVCALLSFVPSSLFICNHFPLKPRTCGVCHKMQVDKQKVLQRCQLKNLCEIKNYRFSYYAFLVPPPQPPPLREPDACIYKNKAVWL